MIVPQRLNRRAVEEHGARAAFFNSADWGQRHSIGSSRHTRSRWDSKEQFVIFSAVEGLLGSGAGETGRRIDRGAGTRSETKPVQVDREAVAEVHCGCGSKVLAEENA